MPVVPGGSVALDRPDHGLGQLPRLPARQCPGRGATWPADPWVERLRDHPVDGRLASEHGGGLGSPCAPLLGFGAGLVLGLARFQVGPLRESDRLAGGGRAPVFGLERLGEVALPRRDEDGPLGPRCEEVRVYADDLTDGTLLRVGVFVSSDQGGRALLEVEAQTPGELCFEQRVVPLGQGDVQPVQGPAVDREPVAPGVLHFVADGHVRVQVWVARPGVAMHEHGRHQSPGGHLLDPAAASTGEQSLGLEPAQGPCHRGLMCAPDPQSLLTVGKGPQGRHRLDRREGQVVPGHGTGLLAGFAGQVPRSLPLVHRVAPMLGPEQLVGDLGADSRADLWWHRCLPVLSPFGVVGREALGHLTDQAGRAMGDGKRSTERTRPMTFTLARTGGRGRRFRAPGRGGDGPDRRGSASAVR